MNLGIYSVKEFLEFIVLLFGILSFCWAFYTFGISKKQFQHGVMISCIERFQSILAELKSSDGEVRKRGIEKYVDLCNEELFFFQAEVYP